MNWYCCDRKTIQNVVNQPRKPKRFHKRNLQGSHREQACERKADENHFHR